MPSPSFLLQVIAGIRPDTGRVVDCELDTNDEASPLVLTGFQTWRHERVIVPPSTADQAFTFTNAIALVLFASAPIGVRLVAAQALLPNLRFYGWCADDSAESVHATSILLTNASTTESSYIDVLIIEKP